MARTRNSWLHCGQYKTSWSPSRAWDTSKSHCPRHFWATLEWRKFHISMTARHFSIGPALDLVALRCTCTQAGLSQFLELQALAPEVLTFCLWRQSPHPCCHGHARVGMEHSPLLLHPVRSSQCGPLVLCSPSQSLPSFLPLANVGLQPLPPETFSPCRAST